MFARIKFLLLYALCWVLFFEVARLLFISYHWTHAKNLSFQTIAGSLWFGLRMDVSMTAYILAPVCVFVLLSLALPIFRKPILYKVYTALVLLFVFCIVCADLEAFKAWGFRLDATVLKYLDSPKEAWASVSHLPIFWIVFLFILVFAILCHSTLRVISNRIYLLQGGKHRAMEALIIVAFTAFQIIPIRGGLQLAPMNQSGVYFSTNNFANQAAINPVWNIMYGVLDKTAKTKNPYFYLSPAEAKNKVDSLYKGSGEVTQLLKTQKPNIIFVIWESFTEKATHAVIDGKEVTPQFNQLKKEGVYFSQAYASGDRTDRGLPAVLSGYPAMPQTSIIRTPNKSAKIESLSHLLSQQGYATSFYYGGETEFANIKSYLLQSGFEKITDINAFTKKEQNSKWGAHDGIVAERMLNDLNTVKQPFFCAWLTLSSHEPFETPTALAFATSDDTRKFLNSMHYTDDVLGRFIASCKRQAWWNNTLLIVVADHGHPLPATNSEIDRFKIPVLWLGGALKKGGIELSQITSQVDIAATLASQIGLQAKAFPFSKNSLGVATKPWAFFAFNNGFGYLQPGGGFVFDNIGKQMVEKRGVVSEQMEEAGKALQQQTFQDYLDK